MPCSCRNLLVKAMTAVARRADGCRVEILDSAISLDRAFRRKLLSAAGGEFEKVSCTLVGSERAVVDPETTQILTSSIPYWIGPTDPRSRRSQSATGSQRAPPKMYSPDHRGAASGSARRSVAFRLRRTDP